MTRDEAVTLIRASDLNKFADVLINQLCPSVLIDSAHLPREELTIGASRFGGGPDLPEGFQWPRWNGSKMAFDTPGTTYQRVPFQERPLHFIAQFDLNELRDLSACRDLPSKGMLYFFYDLEVQPWGFDPADHLGSRVIYVADPIGSLTRQKTAHPDSAAESHSCALTFSEDWTIPDGESLGVEYQNDLAVLESIDELKQDLIGASEDQPFKPTHRLLGWPEPVQGDMQLECQLVANGIYCGNPAGYQDPRAEQLAAGAKDWRLLLQIDTDEAGPGWMWGDCGRIYYWIHKNDLRHCRFENARLILQCS